MTPVLHACIGCGGGGGGGGRDLSENKAGTGQSFAAQLT